MRIILSILLLSVCYSQTFSIAIHAGQDNSYIYPHNHTDGGYISTKLMGTFSNSATTDTKLSVKFIIAEKVSIQLYEYAGNHPIKGNSSKGKEYDIKIKHNGEKIDFIGFHGHTIIHKPDKGYSIQMGDGQLLSQILKQKVIYNFRKKDIENKGEGAPLASIYHYNLSKKMNLREPVIFLNIGGISNVTYINKNEIQSQDIGPGNVLMDEYIKKIKNQKFDKEGYYASIGKVDKKIINQSIQNELLKKKHSFDKKDFNYSFIKSLNFEDAMATLTHFTAKIISNFLNNNHQISKVVLCGGGRKNKTLINHIKDLTSKDINDINDFGIDGDYVESQAFGYLAIRSFLKKKISFPQTTKVKQSITGGELVKNY